MALPKPHRLQKRQDFSQVYRQGIRCRGQNLSIWALQEGSQAHQQQMTERIPPRIGISISKKVSKKAVVRNRIKRQIRGACRELLPHILPGWKIVISVRVGAQECEYEHFLRELEQLLAQAEVLNGYSREHIL